MSYKRDTNTMRISDTDMSRNKDASNNNSYYSESNNKYKRNDDQNYASQSSNPNHSQNQFKRRQILESSRASEKKSKQDANNISGYSERKQQLPLSSQFGSDRTSQSRNEQMNQSARFEKELISKINELRDQLDQKTSECNKLNEQLNGLYPRRLNSVKNELAGKYPNPELLTIENDKFKELYYSIYADFRTQLDEKEQILQSLRVETITNEEQKNYIDMLKQTLENSIVKNGISDILNAQRLQNYPRDVDNLDVLVDVTLLRSDCEKFRKEALKHQVAYEQLSEEFDKVLKNLEEEKIKNSKISEENENLLINLNKKENNFEQLKEDFERAQEELSKNVKNNEKLSKEVALLSNKNSELEKEKSDFNRKNLDLLDQNETMQSLKTKYGDLRKDFNKQKEDYESLLQEKYDLVSEKSKTNGELATLSNENKKLGDKLKQLGEARNQDIQSLTFESEKLKKKIAMQQKEIQNYQNRLDTVMKESKLFQDKLSLVEQANEENLVAIDDSKKAFETQKVVLENEIVTKERLMNETERKCEEILRDHKKLNIVLEDHKREIQKLTEVIIENEKCIKSLENEIDELRRQRDLLKTDKINKEKEITRLNNTVEEKNSTIDRISDELSNFDKKNADLTSKLLMSKDDNSELVNNRNNLIDEKEKMKNDISNILSSHKKDIGEIKTKLSSLMSNIKFNVHKLKKCIDADEYEMLSDNFINNVQVIDKADEEIAREDSILLTLFYVEDFIKTVGSEIENMFNESMKLNLELVDKNMRVENLMKDLDETKQKLFNLEDRERVLNLNLLKESEARSQIKSENVTLSRKIDQLYETNTKQKGEIVKLNEDLLAALNNCESLGQLNNNLIQDLNEKNAEINSLLYQIESLENRMKILVKERKTFKDLISKIINLAVHREQMELSNDLLIKSEEYFDLEREKLKTEGKLAYFNKSKGLNESKGDINEYIQEKENLHDIEIKQRENLSLQSILETKIRNIHDDLQSGFKLNVSASKEKETRLREIRDSKEQASNRSQYQPQQYNPQDGQITSRFKQNPVSTDRLISNYAAKSSSGFTGRDSHSLYLNPFKRRDEYEEIQRYNNSFLASTKRSAQNKENDS